MLIRNPATLRVHVPAGHGLLGLDLGRRRIGLAASDRGLMVATPLETLTRRKFRQDAAHYRQVMAARHLGGIVLGWPVEMDGTEGPACQAVREYARLLVEALAVPVTFWDERLSTAAVERMLVQEADLSRARRAAVVDRAAAAYILQGLLDALPDLTAAAARSDESPSGGGEQP